MAIGAEARSVFFLPSTLAVQAVMLVEHFEAGPIATRLCREELAGALEGSTSNTSGTHGAVVLIHDARENAAVCQRCGNTHEQKTA
jgi:hypothetical protein